MATGTVDVQGGEPQPEQAWDLVAAGFFLVMLSAGLRFAVGPFVEPLLADFGFSRTYLSSLIAVGMIIYGVATALAGRLSDRLGTKRVVIAGSFILAISLFLLGWTRSPLVFSLTFAGVSSVAFGATSNVVFNPMLSRWFIKKRGLALSLMTAGSMSGIALVTPLSSLAILWLGWRGTYFVIGAIILLVLLPVLYFTLPNDRHSVDGLDRRLSPATGTRQWQQALHTAPFWLLAISFFGCGFSMNLLGSHGVPMLQSHGFSPVTGAFAIGLIGFISVFTAPMLGWASDRWGRTNFLALIYFVRSLGFFTLIAISRDWQLFAIAAAGGLAWAGTSALTSALTADIYGTRYTGTLYGLMFLGHQLGAASGSFLGGWSFEALGTYHPPFLIAGSLLLLGAVFSWRLPARTSIIPLKAGA